MAFFVAIACLNVNLPIRRRLVGALMTAKNLAIAAMPLLLMACANAPIGITPLPAVFSSYDAIPAIEPVYVDQIAFGVDDSAWSLDGECDDPRFTGEGMAPVLLQDEEMRDATDCSTLFQSGRINLASTTELEDPLRAQERRIARRSAALTLLNVDRD